MEDEKKQCTRCEAWRHIEEFELFKSGNSKKGASYRKNTCKPCGLELHARREAKRRLRIHFTEAKKRAAYEAVVDIIIADKQLMAKIIHRNPMKYHMAVATAFKRNVDEIKTRTFDKTGGFPPRYFHREEIFAELEKEFGLIDNL